MGNVVTDSGLRIPITDAGVELVTNGTFDTDISGWTDSVSANSVWDAGRLRLDTSAVWQWAWSNFSTKVGRAYVVTGDWESSGNPVILQIQLGSDGGNNGSMAALNIFPTSGGDSGTFEILIVANTANSAITLKRQDADGDVWFDNISIKPLHYNADASGPFGYLSESAGTNLLTYSEEFDNAAWTKTNATITADDAVAPDGSSTADKLTDDAAFAAHRIYGTTGVGAADSTISVFAKAGTADFIGISHGDTAAGYAVFDLSDGTIAASANGDDYGVHAVGNGWYRCWMLHNNNSYLAVNIGTTAAEATPGTPYSGSGSYVYVWGAQVEQNSFPTSYIKTEAATVTRSADVLTYDDVGNIENASGTVKCEASTLWGEAPANSYAIARDGAGLILYSSTGSAPTSIASFDGTASSSTPIGSSMEGSPILVASSWGDSLTAYYDGSPDLTPAAYDGSMGAGDLAVGCWNGGSGQFNGTIRLLQIHSKEGVVS